MKIAPATQTALLALAGVDAELTKLAKTRTTHPEVTAHTAATEQVKEIRTERSRTVMREDALTREQQRLERDHGQLIARLADDKRQLNTGQLSAAEAVELRRDNEAATRRLHLLLADQSELSAQQDALRQQLEALTAQLAAAETALEKATYRRGEATADMDAAEAQLLTERDTLRAGIDAAQVEFYDTQRERAGLAVAALRGTACSVCFTDIEPYQRDALADPAEVLICTSCGMHLLRS